MKEYVPSDSEIRYLLHESRKGNARCAFLAGLSFEKLGYRRLFVQKQFRYAADLGYPVAQRWLGVLGLCRQLLSADSQYANEIYCPNYEDALYWLEEAAENHDPVSCFILAKCRMLGIGVKADEAEAQREIDQLIPLLTEESVLAVTLLFDLVLNMSPADLNYSSLRPLYDLAV